MTSGYRRNDLSRINHDPAFVSGYCEADRVHTPDRNGRATLWTFANTTKPKALRLARAHTRETGHNTGETGYHNYHRTLREVRPFWSPSLRGRGGTTHGHEPFLDPPAGTSQGMACAATRGLIRSSGRIDRIRPACEDARMCPRPGVFISIIDP